MRVYDSCTTTGPPLHDGDHERACCVCVYVYVGVCYQRCSFCLIRSDGLRGVTWRIWQGGQGIMACRKRGMRSMGWDNAPRLEA
jgi:hypothetical protein